jgi:acetolactate synthase small subunit
MAITKTSRGDEADRVSLPGLVEVSRTGVVAIARGPEGM